MTDKIPEGLSLTNDEKYDALWGRNVDESMAKKMDFAIKAQLAKVLNAGYISPEEHQRQIEEAKTQERERILALLEKEYPAITTWQCWQALR